MENHYLSKAQGDADHGYRRRLDSVKVWKAFASTYPNKQDISLMSKQHIVSHPNMKILDYIKPVVSPSFDWITFLALSNITCSSMDLIQISQLTNLGVLSIGPHIQAPEIGLDDSVIRSWGRTAATSNAFSMLRVLNCRSQKEVTSRAFSHLNQFPALALFSVENCNLGSQEKSMALQHGWKYRTGKDLSDWLVKGGASGARWDSIMYTCFGLGGAFSVEALTAEGVAVVDALPVLHLSLGRPQKDAALDKTGNRSLRFFYRVPLYAQELVESGRSAHKRLLGEVTPPGQNPIRKKPTIRASKLQDIGDLLSTFGS